MTAKTERHGEPASRDAADPAARYRVARGFGLFALLAAIWLLLSGHYAPLTLACGLLSCLLVTWLTHRMDHIDHESVPVHLTTRLPAFWIWLAWEVLKSSWDVSRRLLRLRPDIDPLVETITSGQPSDLTRATLANAISLTPGTLSMRLSADGIEVHALAPENLRDLRNGRFPARIAALED